MTGDMRGAPVLSFLEFGPTATQPALAGGPAHMFASLAIGSLSDTKAFLGRVQSAADR